MTALALMAAFTLSGCSGSSDDAKSSAMKATSATSSTTAGSSSTTSAAASSQGGKVKAASFKNAPKVVGRWKLATTVDPTDTSAVYNDGNGVGANYVVSTSMRQQDAREQIRTGLVTIPGGFCGEGTAHYAQCFLKTDTGGMVTSSATAADPKDNLAVSKEFAQALYNATK